MNSVMGGEWSKVHDHFQEKGGYTRLDMTLSHCSASFVSSHPFLDGLRSAVKSAQTTVARERAMTAWRSGSSWSNNTPHLDELLTVYAAGVWTNSVGPIVLGADQSSKVDWKCQGNNFILIKCPMGTAELYVDRWPLSKNTNHFLLGDLFSLVLIKAGHQSTTNGLKDHNS